MEFLAACSLLSLKKESLRYIRYIFFEVLLNNNLLTSQIFCKRKKVRGQWNTDNYFQSQLMWHSHFAQQIQLRFLIDFALTVLVDNCLFCPITRQIWVVAQASTVYKKLINVKIITSRTVGWRDRRRQSGLNNWSTSITESLAVMVGLADRWRSMERDYNKKY